MDRAVVGEVDVISGLQNTITILGPRLKDVSLSREYEKDLPGIPGRGGELNQVWTNLIDNAIDAVDGRGSITIRAYVEGAAWWSRSSTTGVGYRARRRSTSSSLSTPQRTSGPGPGSGWISCGASSPVMEARSLSSQSLGRHVSR